MKKPLSDRGISLEISERQLDRVQNFFSRIDSKVSALLAIASAQVAVVAINLTWVDLKVCWIAIASALFLLAIGWTFVNLYRCTYPSLGGGKASLVYFAEISKLDEDEFMQKFSLLSEEELTKDVLSQVWRNSEIVAAKYRYLKSATISVILSTIPWTAILVATSIAHSRLPALQ